MSTYDENEELRVVLAPQTGAETFKIKWSTIKKWLKAKDDVDRAYRRVRKAEIEIQKEAGVKVLNV